MQKVIGVTELQRHFRTVFDEVAHDNQPYVLTRGSRPEAALIPYESYLHLMQLQEEILLAEFDQLSTQMATKNRGYTEAEVAADVANAVREHRDDSRRS